MANLGYIQVIRRCSQTCRFCSNPANERVFPLSRAKALVNRYAERGYEGVILTGGEPTLYDKLPELISYVRDKGLGCRVITNGQRTCDRGYLDALFQAGLRHVNVSVHSHRKAVQAFLTNNPDSLANICRSLVLLAAYPMTVHICQTVCRQNGGHLAETAAWLIAKFPHIKHFSWTYLDTFLDRVAEHPEVVPCLRQTEGPLIAAMRLLDRSGRTFRVEKVPLCYMGEFCRCSTETRAIVQGAERGVHFLDGRRSHRELRWRYKKAPVCGKCSLDSICAGLWDLGKAYDPCELKARRDDPEAVIRAILEP
ncbi:MAG: radical SAM protein [Elusimicrobia bacterium]|nr:radical SAM protein [Elusimicrobiota bacterium]